VPRVTAQVETDYHELCAYTLAHADPFFIHQLVVDAWAAQTATADDKPIKLTFALVGLYLHLEHGFTGRQVQLAHMKLARYRDPWPRFALPDTRGEVTPSDVMAAPAGPARDAAIRAWCASVWNAFQSHRETIHALLRVHRVL